MKRTLGIAILLLVTILVTGLLNSAFFRPINIFNTLQWSSLYGLLSIAAAFVIVTGGIDLSIGSVVGLVGAIMPLLLVKYGWSVPTVLGFVLVMSVLIGLVHGLLITKLNLQPFVVTLCTLMIYRGIARYVTADATQGFGNKYPGLRALAKSKLHLFGEYDLPMPFLILLAVTAASAVILNKTVWGRYLQALGRNEQAARYSGIDTDLMKIVAYMLCSLITGIGGVLLALDLNSMQPSSHGSGYELYAIAGAVLGGCSLRGGEASIVGAVIGTVLMRTLYNSINLLGISTTVEYAVIGGMILVGVIVDELLRRFSARRRRAVPAEAPAAPPPSQLPGAAAH